MTQFMNKFRRYYCVAILSALTCTTLFSATERTVKQRSIAAVQEEIKLFRDAIEGTQKCITRKPCPRKQKQAMFRAAKHGLAIIAIMASLGTLTYKAVPKKLTEKELNIIADLSTEISLLNDDTVTGTLSRIKLPKNALNALLVIAAHHGTDSAVKALLNSGAQANFIDRLNTSVLHHAAARAGSVEIDEDREKRFHEKIIDLLIEQGAPINHQSGEFKATALMEAGQHHNLYLVEKLLKAGADKTIRDKYGDTAYDYAKESEKPPEKITPPAMLEKLRLPK